MSMRRRKSLLMSGKKKGNRERTGILLFTSDTSGELRPPLGPASQRHPFGNQSFLIAQQHVDSQHGNQEHISNHGLLLKFVTKRQIKPLCRINSRTSYPRSNALWKPLSSLGTGPSRWVWMKLRRLWATQSPWRCHLALCPEGSFPLSESLPIIYNQDSQHESVPISLAGSLGSANGNI